MEKQKAMKAEMRILERRKPGATEMLTDLAIEAKGALRNFFLALEMADLDAGGDAGPLLDAHFETGELLDRMEKADTFKALGLGNVNERGK